MNLSIPIPKNYLSVSVDDVANSLREDPSSVLVVDVRESDYEGGHLKGSMHVPYGELESRLKDIAAAAQGRKRVVFTCMYGQLRGPSAALTLAQGKEHAVSAEICAMASGVRGFVKKFGTSDDALFEGFEASLWTADNEYVHDTDIASYRVKSP